MVQNPYIISYYIRTLLYCTRVHGTVQGLIDDGKTVGRAGPRPGVSYVEHHTRYVAPVSTTVVLVLCSTVVCKISSQTALAPRSKQKSPGWPSHKLKVDNSSPGY